jgi:hypothetical protein
MQKLKLYFFAQWFVIFILIKQMSFKPLDHSHDYSND